MKRRTFFLDADGTAINTMLAIYRALCLVFAYFGVKPPTFSEYVLGIKDCYYTFYKERIPQLESEEQLMSLWREFLSEHDTEIPEVFEGFYEFVDQAVGKGVELVLLSANGGPTIQRWLDRENLRRKFSAIYTGKTDKASVITSHLEITGKEKSWAYMIGDSLLDCHAAKVSGVEFVGVLHDITQGTAEYRVPEECLIAIRHHFESMHHFVAQSFKELSVLLLSE